MRLYIKGIMSLLFMSGILFSQNEPGLKDVFKDYFLVGAALNPYQFTEKDELSVGIIKKHFNTVTPENDLKWERVHPKLDKYSFDNPDKYIEFGKKNNMVIIGHTLIWHAQTPRWVFEDKDGKPVDKNTLLERMREHIQTVVGRYKGQIKGWDVVNEALEEDGTLRKSPWLKIVGEEFIAKAFQFAHEADPDAELYYNDYSLENKSKRDGVVALVKKLQQQGIRIDGVGLQGHYQMDWPSAEQIDSTITAIANLNVKIMVTELDLNVLPNPDNNQTADISKNYELKEKFNPYSKGLPDSAKVVIAKRYGDIFSAFIKNHKVIDRITFWGVTDKSSWLNNWPVFGRTNYPLLFDREGKPNSAFFKIVELAKNK